MTNPIDSFLEKHPADGSCDGPGVQCLSCEAAREIRKLRNYVEMLQSVERSVRAMITHAIGEINEHRTDNAVDALVAALRRLPRE